MHLEEAACLMDLEALSTRMRLRPLLPSHAFKSGARCMDGACAVLVERLGRKASAPRACVRSQGFGEVAQSIFIVAIEAQVARFSCAENMLCWAGEVSRAR